MFSIVKRNVKVFFRDKTSVFFSLLSVFIIIGLYVLFLGDLIVGNMGGTEGARFLIDSWIMAGVIAVTSITTTMGAFGAIIEDETKKINKDFAASPIKRYQLAGGYILSSWIIGIIMCLVALVLAEVYIIIYGGHILPIRNLLKLLGLIPLSVLSGSALGYFIISFIKSANAYGTANTILGTLIGFLTGIYIPLGNLPSSVQTVVKIFPVSHAGALFRQVMMDEPIQQFFGNAPAQTTTAFKEEMGVIFSVGGVELQPWHHILILVATAVLFYALGIWRISRKKR